MTLLNPWWTFVLGVSWLLYWLVLLLVLLEHSPNDSSLWWSEWPCLKCSSISFFVSFSAPVFSPSNAAFVKLYEFWTKDVCFVALVLLLFVELSAFCRDFKRDLRVSIVVVVLPFLLCLYCFLSDRSSLIIWATSLYGEKITYKAQRFTYNDQLQNMTAFTDPISFSAKNTWRKLSLIKAIWNLFNFPLISILSKIKLLKDYREKSKAGKSNFEHWLITIMMSKDCGERGVFVRPLFFKEHSYGKHLGPGECFLPPDNDFI